MSDERKDFESWATDNRIPLDCDEHGFYMNPATIWTWTAWRAQQMVIQVLKQRIAELEEEKESLKNALCRYENGYQGSCYACEPVGEKNVSLEIINKGLDAANVVLSERIAELEQERRWIPVTEEDV